MSIQNLCFCIVALLLLPCRKPVSGVVSVVGDGRMKRPRCMENEREALLKFKQALVDENGFLSSWGTEEDKKDCCKWRGITCSNRTGHVIALDLLYQGGYSDQPDHPLRGKISPSLLELEHLTYLDLGQNNFGGRIPKFIGSLSRLQYLYLLDNEFLGTIPHELGNLTNLRYLYLGSYAVTHHLRVSNLEWLTNLRLLQTLYLGSIDLGKSIWWHSIDKLSFLSELSLVSCELPGIISPPLHLANFSSIPLAILDLSGNNFISSSVYIWLFNFSSTLVDIDLSQNLLGGSIPYGFGNMASLERLRLSNNSLEGEIPKSFRNLTRLRSLAIASNNLTGQLPEIFNTLIASKNSLRSLWLYSNKIFGPLPDFTRFSSLRILMLGDNELQGSLPTSFGQSSPLVILNLSYNKLNGSITDLTSFPSLGYLSLNDNKLEGRVPESIGQLSNLEELHLSSNFLSLEFRSDWTPLFQLNFIRLANCKLGPRFPEWIRSQNNFSMLDISHTGISDTAPNWFWNLSPRLVYLNISNNQIHGMLPDLSLNFVQRSILDLRSNHFGGPIPLLPPNMSLLDLSKNMFSGSIISLCTIATEVLGSLDLSENLLSGEVPDCWIRAKELQILNLGVNNFSGKIPATFGFLHRLQLLSFRNNNLTGELPSSLKNCTALQVIDVSENMLSGQVPAWIGTYLTSLHVLIFRRNEFYGSIPPSICNLVNTHVLDLSQNKIKGRIPQCLNKLSSLIQTNSSSVALSFESSGVINYFDHMDGFIYYSREYLAGALVHWKGQLSQYRNNLGLLKFIDLSSNKLVGKIPQELAGLEGLISLNLSRNHLTGNIIQTIGQMKMLEGLDLSKNQLSGEIPISLARLNFLSVLDLSSNNFLGKIPSSTQLQSFNASSYAGNRYLCGLPLPNKCPEDESAPICPSPAHCKDETNEEEDDTFATRGFYISLVLGFSFAFWGFFGSLLLRSSWRYAYFKFLDKIQDWIFVTIAVTKERLQRMVRG